MVEASWLTYLLFFLCLQILTEDCAANPHTEGLRRLGICVEHGLAEFNLVIARRATAIANRFHVIGVLKTGRCSREAAAPAARADAGPSGGTSHRKRRQHKIPTPQGV